MAKNYRTPTTGGKKHTHESHPGGVHTSGTPDAGAIPKTSPNVKPTPTGQPLTGSPGNRGKPGSKPLRGRSTPGRSTTKGLKGTPNNG